MQTRIPCVMMRGGTSRGPYFLAEDLPAEAATRDAVLIAAMGSPHVLQVDGIGGGNTLTSKVAIISRSAEPGVDVDYLFAQVAPDRLQVDTRPNCGNMLAGVGPFAIEQGLVQTPDGAVTYDGEASIPGVAGTAAPIQLRFREVAGAKTGRLFPTGARAEVIEGTEVSLVDCAMPCMLLKAADVGVDITCAPAVIDNDKALLVRLETLRLEAGRRMGFGDVSDSVVPKIALVGPGAEGACLTARYLTPHAVHKALAVTGGICIATAARIPGTVAHAVAQAGGSPVRIAHPSGVLDVALELNGEDDVAWAGVLRTARRIFEGNLLVPARIWAGRQALAKAAE
jgi:2-methylaconitate cis-trans-isomerase PrpF